METEELVGRILASIVMLFLGPALFIWVWNWQFSDWYVFTYWQALWLGVALSFLIRR